MQTLFFLSSFVRKFHSKKGPAVWPGLCFGELLVCVKAVGLGEQPEFSEIGRVLPFGLFVGWYNLRELFF